MTASTNSRQILITFLSRLLRPVARLCIKNGLLLSDAIESLKQAFVDEGVLELESRGLKKTVSHLSIMSGVHRKDVTRLINSDTPADRSASLAAQVIGLWKNHPDYHNKIGKPALLSFGGSDSTFSSLVRVVNRELNPGTILKELERVGAVRRTEQGLKLVEGAYLTRKDSAMALELLSRQFQDLTSSVDQNVTGTDPIPNLHLSTDFDAIPDSSLPVVREWILKEGSLFHQRANEFLGKHDADTNPRLAKQEGRNRAVVVAYSLAEKTKA